MNPPPSPGHLAMCLEEGRSARGRREFAGAYTMCVCECTYHQTQSLQIIFFEDNDVLTKTLFEFKNIINFTSSFRSKKCMLYDVLKY